MADVQFLSVIFLRLRCFIQISREEGRRFHFPAPANAVYLDRILLCAGREAVNREPRREFWAKLIYVYG